MEFFKELRSRKVIRVAVVYVVTAWVLIQVAGEVAEPLRLPDWFSTAVIVLLALGFPIALALAWFLELDWMAEVKQRVLLEERGNSTAISLRAQLDEARDKVTELEAAVSSVDQRHADGTKQLRERIQSLEQTAQQLEEEQKRAGSACWNTEFSALDNGPQGLSHAR